MHKSRANFGVNSKTAHLRSGFSLVEILISTIVILGIVTMILISSSSLTFSRSANLRTAASKIATKEIENVRNSATFDSITTGAISDPDITAKLGAGATGTRTVSNYSGSADIKLVTVQINWPLSGAAKSLKMETLIYRYGL